MIMATSLSLNGQKKRKKWKQWQIFSSWAPKSLRIVTTALKFKDACSFEGKLWQNWTVLKTKGITLPTKVHIVKAMVFPVAMYGCDSWTIKKSENQRIDASELWCWRRLWRVLLTAGNSNQQILKEIIPEYSLEWLMLKLKLQYFGHLMWKANSVEKTLMLGMIEDKGRRGRQRMR